MSEEQKGWPLTVKLCAVALLTAAVAFGTTEYWVPWVYQNIHIPIETWIKTGQPPNIPAFFNSLIQPFKDIPGFLTLFGGVCGTASLSIGKWVWNKGKNKAIDKASSDALTKIGEAKTIFNAKLSEKDETIEDQEKAIKYLMEIKQSNAEKLETVTDLEKEINQLNDDIKRIRGERNYFETMYRNEVEKTASQKHQPVQ